MNRPMTIEEELVTDSPFLLWSDKAFNDFERIDKLLSRWNAEESTSRYNAEMLIHVIYPSGRCIKDAESIILTSLNECIEILRPYFEESKYKSVSTSTLIENQRGEVDPYKDSEKLGIWDHECPWKSDSLIRDAPLWILKSLGNGSLNKFENASKFVPFLLYIAEDTDSNNRIVGVEMIHEYLRTVPIKFTIQLQLHELMYSILEKNLYRSDHPQLVSSSLKVFTTDLIGCDEFTVEKKQQWIEPTLNYILKESLMTGSTEMREIFLSNVEMLIRHLELMAVTQVGSTLQILKEIIPENELISQYILEILDAFVDCAWPRLANHITMMRGIISNLPSSEFRQSILNKLAILE